MDDLVFDDGTGVLDEKQARKLRADFLVNQNPSEVQARRAVLRIMGVAGYEVSVAGVQESPGECMGLGPKSACHGHGRELRKAACANPTRENLGRFLKGRISLRMGNYANYTF